MTGWGAIGGALRSAGQAVLGVGNLARSVGVLQAAAGEYHDARQRGVSETGARVDAGIAAGSALIGGVASLVMNGTHAAAGNISPQLAAITAQIQRFNPADQVRQSLTLVSDTIDARSRSDGGYPMNNPR